VIEEATLREAVEAEFAVQLRSVPTKRLANGGRSYRGMVGPFLKDASRRGSEGQTVVCLVPARTDTRWFWDYARWGYIRFLRGRVRFAGERSGAPFPSAIVVFGPGARKGVLGYWNVNTGEIRDHRVVNGGA
jgi:hypothetical protein